MSTNPPTWKPASSAEEEKQRFDSMMADFLKEDDPPPKGNPPPSNPPPSQPSGSGGGGLSLNDVARLLDERDRNKQTDSKLDSLTKEVEELKKREPSGKKRPWWSPLF